MAERANTNIAMPPAPPSARRIHGTIARNLGVDILTGRYQPGETLPGEIEFAQSLRVSRSAYREAVRILIAKGLVESRTRTGTRVSPRERWNLLDPEVLGWSFESEPDEAFVRDLFELRMIVEPAAAEFAAVRRDAADLARLKEAIGGMRRHGLATPEGQAADQAFHTAIELDRVMSGGELDHGLQASQARPAARSAARSRAALRGDRRGRPGCRAQADGGAGPAGAGGYGAFAQGLGRNALQALSRKRERVG